MTAWILSVLLAVAPPGRSRETREDGEARYATIAADVSSAVEAAPALFVGPHGRERGAALLLAVGALESGYARDVDTYARRGPGGECGLWQTMPVRGRCPATRREAAAVALEALRRSLAACRHLPEAERLAVYTSGSCDRGRAASRDRVELAKRLFARHPPR